MATYSSIPSTLPASQRVAYITNVAAGDQIDIESILGKPATKVQFNMTATTDTIEFKLNNLVRIKKRPSDDDAQSGWERVAGFNTEVEVWSGSDRYPTYSSTGSTVLETADGLTISSIEIVSLTLSVGSTISIVAW